MAPLLLTKHFGKLSRCDFRASPVASPKASPKGIWGAPDKKSVPAASPKAHFCPARPYTVSGAPSPSPSHRGRSGDAGHNEKRGGLPHVGDYLHKPLVRASFLVAPSFPRLPPHRRRWISRPFGRLICAASQHRCRGWGSRRSCRRRRVASASQNAPSNPPHLRAQKVLDDLPAMDSDDEMVALLLEDEQAFDDDLREHLLIIASLQGMLDAEAEKRKRPRRGGSRPGRRKSKPRQRMEGHAMLQNDYFADGATHADNFRRRYRMSKGLFMNILQGVREFDPYFKLKVDVVGVLGHGGLACGNPDATTAAWLAATRTTAMRKPQPRVRRREARRPGVRRPGRNDGGLGLAHADADARRRGSLGLARREADARQPMRGDSTQRRRPRPGARRRADATTAASAWCTADADATAAWGTVTRDATTAVSGSA
ncbi:uncharacterized protein [Lolium perenne]|uniref:uncharacterized protein n=1 Tax=Lolium perenne TaxID=4522 RepID=UPI003A991925